MTDWSATGNMLSGIGTSLGALAIVYAAHKGADTFKHWRKQKHHERCMVVAEEILTLSYKLKRALEAIRSPAILGGEMSDILQELRENGSIEEGATTAGPLLTHAQAALSRTQYHRQLFEALLDKIPVAKAIFGDHIANSMNEFWSARAKIVAAAQSYARESLRQPVDAEIQLRYRERIERLECILWSGGDENGVDQLATDIDAAIAQLERQLLPIIRNANQSESRSAVR